MYHRFKRDITSTSGRVAALPFRVLAYALHATGLERFIKPRFGRHSALFELTDEIVSRIPTHSKSMTGARMDPINFIFIGDNKTLVRRFRKAGWHRANPATPPLLIYSALTVLTRRTYRSGPFTPHYVNIALQDHGFQKLTRTASFRQRHHIRIWKTGIRLASGAAVWIGEASFDEELKVQFTPPFIHHRIDPNLDAERDFITRELERVGSLRLKSVALSDPVMASKPASNAHGAQYFTDGRAVVVQL
jgi:undecaprenyl-diphosphatase